MNDANTLTRRFRGDDRAVSPVIGAILMVALAMLLVTILQTSAIPALNSQHEFQHNQEVQTDVVRLESAVDRVAATGTGETTTVDVGLRYPPRLVFINPPPVDGRLRTTDAGTLTIANAAAAGETGDYWNGTTRSFETNAVEYVPSYNEYGEAPVTVYEPWVVYNRFDEATLALTDTDIVDGREISLVALDGTYSDASADALSVDVAPTSTPVRTVTVRNESAPITISLSTGLREDEWRELLADELDPDGTDDDRYVTALSCSQAPPAPCGELTLTLEPGTYDLRLAAVAVGRDASSEPATYLTDVEGDAAAVLEGGRQRLVVEARDRFDNPVSGVSVTANAGGDVGRVRAVTPVTEPDGRAVFVYDAPTDVNASRNVTVTAQFGEGDAQRTVTFDVRVVDLDGGGGSGGDGGTTSSAESIATVAGSVDSRNIGGSDRGREATFAIASNGSATLTDVSVETVNDLDNRPYVDRDTTFDGGTLPATVDDEFVIALRDIDASADLGLSEFVDPTSSEAKIIVVLEFADGSTRTIALG